MAARRPGNKLGNNVPAPTPQNNAMFAIRSIQRYINNCKMLELPFTYKECLLLFCENFKSLVNKSVL